MTQDQLIELLRRHQWRDVEFKEARRSGPRDAYETVSAFAGDPHLLEPGEREVRNPRIVLAFRRIGLSEHAGWGLRDVFRNWQQLGYVPPRIVSDRRRKSFELVLTKEALLSDSQPAGQRGLGLMDEEARASALACREPDIGLWQIKVVTGFSGPESSVLADRMVDRVLIERAGPDRYVLAEHLRRRRPRNDQVSDQVRATRPVMTMGTLEEFIHGGVADTIRH